MISIGLTLSDAKRIAWTFVMAFAGSFLVLAPGILAAPNLTNAKALAASAVMASIAAGVSAVKNGLLSDTSGLK